MVNRLDIQLLFVFQAKNYLGLGIENGFLKIAMSSEKNKQSIYEIPSYTQVSDGLWHNVELQLDPLVLHLDNKTFEIQKKLEKSSKFYITGNFYIGGLPNVTNLDEVTNGLFQKSFEGCIAAFGTNMDVITDFSHMEGSNIDTCHVLAT